MQTTKEKIDKILGIEGGKSIDDAFEDLSFDTKKIQDTMDGISDEVKGDLQKVDEQIQLAKEGGDIQLQLDSLDSSMKEVEDLILLAKAMFKHVYESVVSSDLCDSELIGSVSKLLESIHINISEFISMYKDKEKFVEKIKLMAYAQKQKIDLMNHKHKLEMEKIAMKAEQGKDDAIDVQGNVYQLDQEGVVKALAQLENKGPDDGFPEVCIPSDSDVKEKEESES